MASVPLSTPAASAPKCKWREEEAAQRAAAAHASKKKIYCVDAGDERCSWAVDITERWFCTFAQKFKA
jgi:hypothetical protein